MKAPIFVAREWLRHRIGSFNEISGRYVQFEPEFYVPEQFRIKGTTNKQGSIDPPEEWLDANQWYDINDFNTQMAADLTSAYSRVYDSYIELLESGVANEQARMVLPVGLYTQFYWTVNLRALFNFLNLRTAENAQWEIRQYAEAIEQIVAEKVPVAYEAWLSNEKVAP
jgi:thymidylate synthase (FAD)